MAANKLHIPLEGNSHLTVIPFSLYSETKTFRGSQGKASLEAMLMAAWPRAPGCRPKGCTLQFQCSSFLYPYCCFSFLFIILPYRTIFMSGLQTVLSPLIMCIFQLFCGGEEAGSV